MDLFINAGMRRFLTVGLFISLLASPALAQSDRGDTGTNVLRNPEVSEPVYPTIIDIDLRDIPIAEGWKPGDPIKEVPRKRTSRAKEVKPPAILDALLVVQEEAVGSDALSGTDLNFTAQGYTGVNPPDTVGDVGIDYYIQSINGSGGAVYVIYNKNDGSVAAGPFSMDALGSGNCGSGLGDPIILYDELASRWMISEFSNSGNLMCVYVSQTSNPVTGGWYNYSFAGSSFPDYPKYGVWPSAYFAGSNENTSRVYAFDRVSMLAGSPATSQAFSVTKLSGFGFQMIPPADHDGSTAPPANAPGIFMRHRDTEVHSGLTDPSNDYLEIYEFDVDWATPANTTLSGPTQIAISEFDSSLCGLTSFNCFPQPGTSTTLDPLREVVMNRLVYRNFGSHETLVGNLVTDVNGSDRGGVRWFELRNTGGGWSLHQEGTYSPDATNRWMAGIAMDGSGNIAMGYNVSSSSVNPGLRYVGRLATDALGTMTSGEQVIVNGSASNGSNRYGDYSAMGMDPADDCTFWFTGEYNTASQWSTRVASFRFDECGCTPTAAPSGLGAVTNGFNQIDLTWSSVAGATSYRVYRAESSCPAGSYSLIGSSATASYSDTTVAGGVTYAYVVTGFIDAENCESAYSNCADVTATGACTTPPTFAGATAAINLAQATCAIEVQWAAGSVNCGTSVAYNLYRSTTSGFTPSGANLIASCQSGTSYVDTDVASGTAYYYVVRAEDNSGEGSGPCSSGNEDTNSAEVSASPTGAGAFNDDMEAGTGNWATSGSGGSDWAQTTAQSSSPTTSYFNADEASVKDRSLEMASGVTIGAGATLEFQSFYNTESTFDGGVLEYSTNGGGSWQDILAGDGGSVSADAGRITANGYNSTISTSYSSPIGGRQAWSGNSGGFLATSVDLSGMSGETVSFRFRMACDSSVAATGWYVDDVAITGGSDCNSTGCTYSISPTTTSVGNAGGSGSVSVTASAGCAWTAVSNDAWITVTSGSAGTGNGSTGYSVAANGGAARSGSITIAGSTFTVNQDAAACSYSISPASTSVGSAGGTGSVSVTAGTGCAWTSVANDAWITVTSGSAGSGNGSTGYSVAANGSASARVGTITIAGSTFTVNQAGATGGSWTNIDTEDFEAGWGIWNDGGSDVRRSVNDASLSPEGTYCVRLRDNSGAVSAMSTDAFNATAYSKLRITFSFQVISFEGAENFFVEYFDGSSWIVVADYVVDVDFTENTIYPAETVEIDGPAMVSHAQMRIRCDASGNGDRVYIGDATIEGFN